MVSPLTVVRPDRRWNAGRLAPSCAAQGTIVTDLDGVVFENHSRYFPRLSGLMRTGRSRRMWRPSPLAGDGAQLFFMTARPEAFGDKRRNTAVLGLEAHALIMDCRHGRRFLINDHAPSNPYPAAVAISTERNSPNPGRLYERLAVRSALRQIAGETAVSGLPLWQCDRGICAGGSFRRPCCIA